MISLLVLFWIFVIIFAFIGLLRGWAKELLVSLGAIAALFLLALIERYVPAITSPMSVTTLFWFRTCGLLALVSIAYLAPKLPALAINVRLSFESLQNSILGMIIGAFNGYLIAGSVWHFLEKAKYPFPGVLTAPDAGGAAGEKAIWLISHLPPTWLEIPTIYFAVVVILVVVILALRS